MSGSGEETGGSRSSSPPRRGKAQILLTEGDRTCFETILLSAELLNDHLPDSYLDAIRQL